MAVTPAHRRPPRTRGPFPPSSSTARPTPPPPPLTPTPCAPVNAQHVLQQSLSAPRLDIAHPSTLSRDQVPGGHPYTRRRWTDRQGTLTHELLTVEGLGHAWSGGAPGASYPDPRGPDATEAIWSFFTRAAAPAASLPALVR